MKAESGHPTLLTKLLSKEFLKFVISGGINTLTTYLMYLLLLAFFDYSLSYTLSYVSGIFLSYYLNTVFVFKEKVALGKFLKFPIVYLVQYLVNIMMLYVLVEHLHLSTGIVPLIVIVITIPITYVLSRLIIKSK
ncbi:polysaccharide synthesis protein GtrA [Paenibacillus sp. FSL R7-0273]|uniref:GtrA family protein n=1 Tax=Paenibacillus sp. FSL R7-0273 TaxID=1536772 RepID=UPI0004F6FD3B|nr:GtrA family protein [Paenibacillus sp. FSL R7-0273]AIQ49621.1 polysaccharide synthesis protein GtrA [Paenibacillus sp. FSL R7-0273]OMF90317.1 polysaccharide synthesis protein GtrA [Paenibacillus sp. FSL R7-0273]